MAGGGEARLAFALLSYRRNQIFSARGGCRIAIGIYSFLIPAGLSIVDFCRTSEWVDHLPGYIASDFAILFDYLASEHKIYVPHPPCTDSEDLVVVLSCMTFNEAKNISKSLSKKGVSATFDEIAKLYNKNGHGGNEWCMFLERQYLHLTDQNFKILLVEIRSMLIGDDCMK